MISRHKPDAAQTEAVSIAQFIDWLANVLETDRCPTASELLAEAEAALTWRVRGVFSKGIDLLRSSKNYTNASRDYIRTVLSQKEINLALIGNDRPDPTIRSTLDSLLRQSALYRSSESFAQAIEFSARFREYAPYNNLLVRVQNPSCSFYATECDWKKRLNRTLKRSARPMLILAPMHPVMLVYDLDQTEGPELPKNLQEFMKVEGDLNPVHLENLIGNAADMGILLERRTLSSTHGGYVTSIPVPLITIHDELENEAALSVFCHEIAHLFLGHLGGHREGKWPGRETLTDSTVEIEAESVAFIVSTRLGLRPCSESYLASHVGNEIPGSVSIEMIAKVAAKIEALARKMHMVRNTNAESKTPLEKRTAPAPLDDTKRSDENLENAKGLLDESDLDELEGLLGLRTADEAEKLGSNMEGPLTQSQVDKLRSLCGLDPIPADSDRSHSD